MERVEKASTGCWLWTGHINQDGYGRICRGGESKSAHRTSYEVFRGPIPDGLVLDHLCRVRHCVNPDHLEPVSIAENIRRGEGVAVQHAAKTHCVHGHEFTPENTLTHHSGSRGCRACARASREKWLAKSGEVNRRVTHCVRGHEYTPENTYMHGRARRCRTCKRERARKAVGT